LLSKWLDVLLKLLERLRIVYRSALQQHPSSSAAEELLKPYQADVEAWEAHVRLVRKFMGELLHQVEVVLDQDEGWQALLRVAEAKGSSGTEDRLHSTLGFMVSFVDRQTYKASAKPGSAGALCLLFCADP
jgi:hypothetical protein